MCVRARARVCVSGQNAGKAAGCVPACARACVVRVRVRVCVFECTHTFASCWDTSLSLSRSILFPAKTMTMLCEPWLRSSMIHFLARSND